MLTNALLVGCLQYEPELFPGLIYRMKQPKIVLLIFVSGKIVLTGAKVWLCSPQSSGYVTRKLMIVCRLLSSSVESNEVH